MILFLTTRRWFVLWCGRYAFGKKYELHRIILIEKSYFKALVNPQWNTNQGSCSLEIEFNEDPNHKRKV